LDASGKQFLTRASSINRALDEIGDKWCLLILQEVFWGINSFNDMLNATGVSRGVLSNRLRWLQDVDCLRKSREGGRPRYHLTAKSIELYDSALMAIAWERRWYRTPQLDDVALVHRVCGAAFQPELRCGHCRDALGVQSVRFEPGPGAALDPRDKKVRRRSSIDIAGVRSRRALYRNLVHLVGDRWTANVIALAFHGLQRFDEFHAELPVATNVLTTRLKFLVAEGVFQQVAYQSRPMRYEYRLTDKGGELFPWFLTLQQWGDRWCNRGKRGRPVNVIHLACGAPVEATVCCSHCGGELRAREVSFTIDGREAALQS
jgi:DNA-binding HxlR family transcriptional regulator